MYSEDDYIMLSELQHFVFCRRQWALIHIEQQWEENYQTASGEIMHEKAHDEGFVERRGDTLIRRGMRVSSSCLGLSGQCDVVEFHRCSEGISLFGEKGHWSVVPVEYKNGKPKEGHEDVIQLCAQAMCLEEALVTTISKGYLYYGKVRHRLEVFFSDELREEVKSVSSEMHDIFRRGYTPKVKPKKCCQSCSLKDICLPKLTKAPSVEQYVSAMLLDGGRDEETS